MEQKFIQTVEREGDCRGHDLAAEVMAFASTLALQPCPLSRPAPALWAVLTAVSNNARKRPQGLHITLQNSDHVLGRRVTEASCQFNSTDVSDRHCTISRRFLGPDGRIMAPDHIPNAPTDRMVACIRDSSSNGTFINFQRLQRNGEEVLRHGDVISLAGTPDNETAFSFVFREVSDHMIGAVSLAPIPSGKAAEQPNKRKDFPPDDVGEAVDGDSKRIKGLDMNDGVSGPVMSNDVHQLQGSNEELGVLVEAHTGMLEVEKMRSKHPSAEAHHASETQSLLFSCHPTGAASLKILDPLGSRQNMQQISSFKINQAKHKIFLSHSGTQKDFVEQLCVDLEARGYLFPFFDQRHHSLPKGKDFAPLIKEAAQLCDVAVIVLSEEFLSSKWPMIELAEFHAAQQSRNQQLNMLPLFFKLSVEDLDDEAIENRWRFKWEQHASGDKRIDVENWSAAVKALRRVNGVIFGKNAMSEVAYRKVVVQSIFKLSPPDLLNGSSRDMIGYDRMCEVVSGQFVEITRVGAQVLGLHAMGGLGKTTLSKALCDYFYTEFLGKVCYVVLGEASRTARMRRQKLMLKMLCGYEDDALDRITNVGQGLTLIQEHMKREPVFLVIDNVTNDKSSKIEAHEYLTAGFHPKSRIMITSRSEDILQALLPDFKFCLSMPDLSEEEAGAIFLRSAAPMKSISVLTHEEQRILRLCIEHCRWRSYHPLALSALGDFFYRFISNAHMLLWKDYLEKNKNPLKDAWKSSDVFSIIGLQFSTFHPSEQLLFLDIALYGKTWLHSAWDSSRDDPDECAWLGSCRNTLNWLDWLSKLHEETPEIMERKLRDLKRSGMINWDEETADSEVKTHDLYREFAEWYVTEHEVKGLKNVWGVFQKAGISLRCDPPESKRWSDLARLQIDGFTCANSKLVSSKAMQELSNLVLLQLHSCTNLRVLNLQGLDCLRHVELVNLTKLVTVMLPGNSSSDEDDGIFYGSLQNVLLEDLASLTHVPDFRSCTSLQSFILNGCSEVTNFEGIFECSQLKSLTLLRLVPHQFGRLPNFKSLYSLVTLRIIDAESVDGVFKSVFRLSGQDDDLEFFGSWGEDDMDDEDDVLNLKGLECCKHLRDLWLEVKCASENSTVRGSSLAQFCELSTQLTQVANFYVLLSYKSTIYR